MFYISVPVDTFIERAESEVQKLEDTDETVTSQKRTYSTSSGRSKDSAKVGTLCRSR